MAIRKSTSLAALAFLSNHLIWAVVTIMLFACGCQNSEDPLTARASARPQHLRQDDGGIGVVLEYDANFPSEMVLVFDVPNIHEKLVNCSGQELELTAHLAPGRLRPDVQYSVSVEDLGSPVRASMGQGSGQSKASIHLYHSSEGSLAPRNDRIRLHISNRGTPIPDPRALYRQMQTGCKDYVGGDLVTVLVDNLKWDTQ